MRDETPNLHLMIPFVRTRWELEACLEAIDASPLGNHRGLHRWVMAESRQSCTGSPSTRSSGSTGVDRIQRSDPAHARVDRDSEICAELFDDADDAVLDAIRRIIATCHEAGITSSLCGQAPSNRPDIARRPVEFGIT